jgi:hypothetical protein
MFDRLGRAQMSQLDSRLMSLGDPIGPNPPGNISVVSHRQLHHGCDIDFPAYNGVTASMDRESDTFHRGDSIQERLFPGHRGFGIDRPDVLVHVVGCGDYDVCLVEEDGDIIRQVVNDGDDPNSTERRCRQSGLSKNSARTGPPPNSAIALMTRSRGETSDKRSRQPISRTYAIFPLCGPRWLDYACRACATIVQYPAERYSPFVARLARGRPPASTDAYQRSTCRIARGVESLDCQRAPTAGIKNAPLGRAILAGRAIVLGGNRG